MSTERDQIDQHLREIQARLTTRRDELRRVQDHDPWRGMQLRQLIVGDEATWRQLQERRQQLISADEIKSRPSGAVFSSTGHGYRGRP